MTSDLDIYRSANELIKQFGDVADIEAAMRADERLAAGDMEGEAVWLRIVKAIAELLSKERPDDAEGALDAPGSPYRRVWPLPSPSHPQHHNANPESS